MGTNSMKYGETKIIGKSNVDESSTFSNLPNGDKVEKIELLIFK